MNAEMGSKVTISKYVWVAIGAAVMLIVGSVWLAASVGNGASPSEIASKPDLPAGFRQSPSPQPNYAVDPPVNMNPAPGSSTPSSVVVRVTPVEIPKSKSNVKPPVPGLPSKPSDKPAAGAKQVAAPIADPEVKDMFPVGDITKEPEAEHPYREMPEAFPSFEYEGKVWSATGSFVSYDEADLVPTGDELKDGQKLYALVDSTAPENVLFVQSNEDPGRFAVYRAS